MELENLLNDKFNYMNRLLSAFQTALEINPMKAGETMDEYFQRVVKDIEENKPSKQQNYTEDAEGKLFVFDPNTISFEELIALENEISKHKLTNLSKDLLYEAKQKGYADRQIAHLLDCLESEVYKKRTEMNINRVYKLVDTCAAEFEAKTPYYYSFFLIHYFSNHDDS